MNQQRQLVDLTKGTAIHAVIIWLTVVFLFLRLLTMIAIDLQFKFSPMTDLSEYTKSYNLCMEQSRHTESFCIGFAQARLK